MNTETEYKKAFEKHLLSNGVNPEDPAQIKNIMGLVLVIPKTGLSPMLFLEWMDQFRRGQKIIQKIMNHKNGSFYIRLNISQDEYFAAATYINSNQ